MGLLEQCSNASYWKGLDYYENNRVKSVTQTDKYEYDAEVEGNEVYHVHLNVKSPRKSTCTCPHAAGRYVICKHKVAVFFTLFPEKAQEAVDIRNSYYREQEEREKEYYRIMQEKTRYIREYVDSLSEEEVRNRLVCYMLDEAMEGEDDPYEDEEYYI